jgi:(2Fe-2S) ferredoxin
MYKPKQHIFVCTSSRANGQTKGYCQSNEGLEIMQRFIEEIDDREIGGDVFLSNTGCFGICEKGPIVVVYPDNVWYGSVSPDDVEEIMDSHIERGEIVERLVI